jgi:beta-glucosidase
LGIGASDAEIEKILKGLTIEEKVGQMTQIAIDDFVDPETDEVIADFGVSVLNVYKVDSVLNTYALTSHIKDVWAHIVAKLQEYTSQNPSGISLLYGLDSIHGATFISNSTLFPHEMGIAATFNPDLAEPSEMSESSTSYAAHCTQ